MSVDWRVCFENFRLHVLRKCQSGSNKINLVIMMATKIRRLGHRRTVSCYESEMQHMAAAIVSEHGGNQHQSNVIPLIYEEHRTASESQLELIARLVQASAQLSNQATTVVEQLEIKPQKGEIFQFGRTRKPTAKNIGDMKVDHAVSSSQQEIKELASSAEREWQLQIIPQIARNGRSKAPRRTKDIPLILNAQEPMEARLNNLMYNRRMTASEGIAWCDLVLSRKKIQKRSLARDRHRLLLYKVQNRRDLCELREVIGATFPDFPLSDD